VNESKLAVPFVTSSPDPEVASKAQRRKFGAADKKRILEEVDRATGPGAMGAILRRERVYSSTRRDQLTHPPYQKPELLATEANQLWSWDITKLRGPVKWTAYHLYVIVDVFSRYVVGWMIAYRESAELAKRLIEPTCPKQNIAPGQLTVHADRGSSMKSKPVALLLADLGVVKTHRRPHVSDDNPYSESQFRTLKYRPGFPDRFGSLEDARHGPPRPSPADLSPPPSGPGCRLRGSSRALRPQTAATTPAARPSLDQQARFGGKNSLNFYAPCLIFVDTHRVRCHAGDTHWAERADLHAHRPWPGQQPL
jgi:transposase InsO family protein